jgi:hypothetical protein
MNERLRRTIAFLYAGGQPASVPAKCDALVQNRKPARHAIAAAVSTNGDTLKRTVEMLRANSGDPDEVVPVRLASES